MSVRSDTWPPRRLHLLRKPSRPFLRGLAFFSALLVAALVVVAVGVAVTKNPPPPPPATIYTNLDAASPTLVGTVGTPTLWTIQLLSDHAFSDLQITFPSDFAAANTAPRASGCSSSGFTLVCRHIPAGRSTLQLALTPLIPQNTSYSFTLDSVNPNTDVYSYPLNLQETITSPPTKLP